MDMFQYVKQSTKEFTELNITTNQKKVLQRFKSGIVLSQNEYKEVDKIYEQVKKDKGKEYFQKFRKKSML